MSWSSREDDRRQLRMELGKPRGRCLLASVLKSCGGYGQTWSDLERGIIAAGFRSLFMDDAIRCLLACRSQQSAPWSEALLILFWNRLVGLHNHKRRWDRDEDALWSNIQWCFLEVIHRIDPTTRPERLCQKIYNDTAHHLHDHYAAEWKRARREVATDPDDLVEFADSRPGIDFDAIDLRRVQASEIDRLRHLHARGRISQGDFHLEVGTRVYGLDLRECAAAIGLNYETAKKRRQRMCGRTRPNSRR